LQDHQVAPMTFNAIEFIAFRGVEFGAIKDRCRQLCEIAQAIGCPSGGGNQSNPRVRPLTPLYISNETDPS